MKININQENTKDTLKNLLLLTKDKEIKKVKQESKYKQVQEEILRSVFK